MPNLTSVSLNEFTDGYEAFQQREKRDAMYKIATFLVDKFWGKPSEMADSLGVLLLTWNQALYRYGLFDFDELERCILNNQSLLNRFRDKDILDYAPSDNDQIRHLFQQFLNALQICEGKSKGRKSPVAVAKALHLLAPKFFPLWDMAIAEAYGCSYGTAPADKYIMFFGKMRNIAIELEPNLDLQPMGKTLLKLIDEYNYAKYTKKWV